MKFQVVIHEADEGGYWAEVPEIPGCASQGETVDEVIDNIREAAAGCLARDDDDEGDAMNIPVLKSAGLTEKDI